MTDNSASMPSVSSGDAPIGPIVGAIIGSVFLLLILGIVIAVVVLYLVRCRSTGGKYSTGRRASEKKAMVECKPYACMHDITEQQLRWPRRTLPRRPKPPWAAQKPPLAAKGPPIGCGWPLRLSRARQFV